MLTRIASAGTGKTTALVRAILDDVLSGTPLRRVAAATFTRRAASDLQRTLQLALDALASGGDHYGLRATTGVERERIQRAREELPMAPIGTIHALLRALLRLHAPALGLDPQFELLSETDGARVYLQELTTLAYLEDEDLSPRERAQHEALFNQRSLARAFRPAADDAAAERLVARHQRVMERYRQRLDGRAMGPADVELAAVTAADDPRTLARWRERVAVAYFDEAQDVSVLQAELIRALERAGVRVSVIGDPKQSIYAWRAASVESFRELLANGRPQAPLTTSYRHATEVARFLNRLTASVANDGNAFVPSEAPTIASARPESGSVRVLWCAGNEGIDALRAHEALLAASELRRLHEREGVPYREMAILIRSGSSEGVLRRALAREGVPANRVQGKDYYQRREVRTLLHALRFALDPSDPARLAPLVLDSPLAPLGAERAHALLRAGEDAFERLREVDEGAFRTLSRVASVRDESGARALERLLHEPLLAGGERLLDALDQQSLDNLEALRLELTRAHDGSVETLVQRLEFMIEHEHAGSVPQTGDGVRITTFHASKGLEWRVALAFDLGRSERVDAPDVLIEHATGVVATKGSERHQVLLAEHKRREQAESERLLYVALSRAREHLILTASSKGKGARSSAIKRLEAMGLGADDAGVSAGVRVERVEYQDPLLPDADAESERAALASAAWTDAQYAPPEPLVHRPSAAERERGPRNNEHEARAHDLVPTLIGVLAHHAIALDLDPESARDRATLAAQSALAPLTNDERARVLEQVQRLLASYRRMRASGLLEHEGLRRNEFDVPFLLHDADGRVWQGTVDQLLQTRSGAWRLRDFKTDAKVEPERYAPQLRLYARAASAWVGAEVAAELVYLRAERVVRLDEVEAAA